LVRTLLRRDSLSASTLMIAACFKGSCITWDILSRQSILEYNGVKPDGLTLSTRAIQQAIDNLSSAGGGTVYATPGVFLV
jgi:polygalacturonase